MQHNEKAVDKLNLTDSKKLCYEYDTYWFD